jgi:hypothetical protein
MKIVTETKFAGAPFDVEVRFTPSSLDVRTEIALDAGRRRVFDALLRVGAWWPQRSRLGATVVLEPRVGGRFFENCDDGRGILLGQVTRLLTPEQLAIEGSFGLDQPVCAMWSVRLDADGSRRTYLHSRYSAFGAFDDDIRSAAGATWEERCTALAHYVAA